MTDCVIVGGGVIGLLTARALRLAGRDVLVVERGRLGGESSWAGGGIVSPLYPWRYSDAVNVLAQRSKRIYPELAAALIEESGVDPELLTTGMLIVHDEEREQADAWAVRYREELRHIGDAAGLHAVCPRLAPVYQRGLWMPTVQQVRNPRLVHALRESGEALGIACREQAEVTDILVEQGRARGIRVGGEVIEAGTVIVASGAWSGRLLSAHAAVDVAPVKGQMIMMKTEPGVLNTMVMSHGHYVIPRKDGHVLAGSTLEHADFDKTVTDEARRDLYSQACELIPVLGNYEVIRHWSGLRPGTKQGIPYICRHDEIAGLYIHAGHYRNGIVLGAASAQLLAELVTGEQPFCDPAPYAMNAVH